MKWVVKTPTEAAQEDQSGTDAPKPASDSRSKDEQHRSSDEGTAAGSSESTAAEERSEQASVASVGTPRRGEAPHGRLGNSGAPRWADELPDDLEGLEVAGMHDLDENVPDSPYSPSRPKMRRSKGKRRGAAPAHSADWGSPSHAGRATERRPSAAAAAAPAASPAAASVVTLGDLGLGGLGPKSAQRPAAAFEVQAQLGPVAEPLSPACSVSESWSMMSTSPKKAARPQVFAASPHSPLPPTRQWPMGDASSRAGPSPKFGAAAGADASARVAPVSPHAYAVQMPQMPSYSGGDASQRYGDASSRCSPVASRGFHGSMADFMEASTPVASSWAQPVASSGSWQPASGGAPLSSTPAAPAHAPGQSGTGSAALQTWLSASGLGAQGDIAAQLRAAAPEVYED